MKNEQFQKWCRNAETLISDHVNDGIFALRSYVRNIPKLISRIVDTAYKMQEVYGNVNLKATETKDSGIWMTTVALNGQTSNFHLEQDCTYTFITVPKQDMDMNNGNNYQRVFLININDENTFAFPMTHNLSFVFSGKFITHRQHCDAKCYNDSSIFYNIVCYGNKRLYSHLKNTFLRNIK